MTSNKKILLLILLLISFSNYSQEKDLIINPYAGISFPTGKLNDFSNNGFVIGTSVDYYVWEKFGFGLDFNYQNNSYKFPYSIPNVSSPFSLTQTENGNWNTSTFTLGPTYRVGYNKFTAEIYSKAGISYTKSPENVIVLSNNGFSKSIFNLPSQERTSFGLTSGIRFNYKISDRFSLFVNPQYVFSSAKVDYCNCGIENSSNPDDLINAQSIKKTINPSYFNLNAGLKWNVFNNKNSISRNIPGCMANLNAPVACGEGGPIVTIRSDWWGQIANDVLNVTVYDGNAIIFSGTSISSNNQSLSNPTGSRNHNFNAWGYEGRTLTVKIAIEDQYGVLNCTNQFDITIPNCQYTPNCGWDYVMSCDENSNAIKINIPVVWSNIPVGSSLNFKLIHQNGTPIPFTSVPNNLPFSISGTGSATYDLFITSNSSVPVVFKMEITDSNGNIICNQAIDTQLPTCDFITCKPRFINSECINGTPQITFELPWANFPLFNGYSIYADVYDTPTPGPTGTPIASIPAYALTGVNGSQTFTVSIPSQYEGTTVYIFTRICEHGGIKDCCPGKLEVNVPECCDDCSKIKIQNNTNHNQQGNGNLNLKSFYISPRITNTGTPIKRILVTLDSFGANNSTSNLIEPIPNFEIVGAGRLSNPIIEGTPIGNFGTGTKRRSNLWSIDFTTAPFSGTADFTIIVADYDRKVIKNYRVKLTIFRTDGSICEEIIKYNN